MQLPEIKRNARCRALLVAGLWLVIPSMASTGAAAAQIQPDYFGHQPADVRGTNNNAGDLVHLAKIIVLKDELRAQPGSDDMANQAVAPRLQSRIRKNSEFTAFVKLVKATSKRKYTAEELRDLYLSFKEWSYHHRRTNQ